MRRKKKRELVRRGRRIEGQLEDRAEQRLRQRQRCESDECRHLEQATYRPGGRGSGGRRLAMAAGSAEKNVPSRLEFRAIEWASAFAAVLAGIWHRPASLSLNHLQGPWPALKRGDIPADRASEQELPWLRAKHEPEVHPIGTTDRAIHDPRGAPLPGTVRRFRHRSRAGPAAPVPGCDDPHDPQEQRTMEREPSGAKPWPAPG